MNFCQTAVNRLRRVVPFWMKKRVLIISTSAGTGHVAAGAALEKAFRADPRVAEVRHEDAQVHALGAELTGSDLVQRLLNYAVQRLAGEA